MGVGHREPARLWALALALTLACAQHTGGAQLSSAPSEEHPHLPPTPQGPGGHALHGVTILPPLRTAPVVRALNPAHSGRVCSTWGDFHYKTFDGDVFRFPGRCNYVFSAHCGAAYEDFNVQLRRGPRAPAGALRGVTMKLRGLVLQLTPSSVLVNGRPTQLPFSQSGVLVEHSASYLKVVARLGLVFMWNQDGSLLLELDTKYANQTCGLCGDFNGVPVFDEFFSHGTKLSAVEFGNLQKMDGPTEQCQDPDPAPPGNCSIGSGLCEELLLDGRFLGCHALVDAGGYVRACQQDLCLCPHADLARCVCPTLAEYSRQCAHAGGLPPDWRGPGLCPQTCPHNMQYRECGSPCADTCSNQEHSQLCEDHCVAGCFCPEGMVLDDIGQTGCIPVSQCPCVHNGATYAPGATYSTDCTNCTCSGGRWSCQEVPCPGTCAVLGGAHFSTFDERPYTVHGDCSYVLAKPCNSSAFTVLAELRRCGLTDSETCLRSLTLSLDGGRTVVEVKASGEVLVNQLVTQLPVSAADVTLFRPSTFFVVAQTHLGLQAEVQLVPTMQVFLRAVPALRGRTCGLCGNFNQNQADDFRALSGVVEGTAAAFANTWKTQAACPNVRGGFEDPCSLSVENERYAQHWCSGLTDPQGPFSPCHAAVSPGPYYSNCLFDTCNCEKSEDCLCAALSAYVRACAARGVLLRGWRAGACAKPMDTCPPSMTYRYHVRTCQPTCRALSSQDPACGVSFVPVDGCTCPDGTFLDDAGSCVPAEACPCYHGDTVVPNGESLHERGAVCTCTQGTLTCIGGNTPEPACSPPMVYVDCRNATPGAAGAGCQKSCHTLDMDCYSPQCVPGCVCPAGLVADGKGGCVAVDDCPCMHNEASYPAGQTIRVGCNTCTCKSRKWQCTDQPCLGTCAVYGEGHYLTFDGQRYSFNGACEYTLLQDRCGGNGSAQDAFRVVTENVPCGTTGTTCSKAIKLFLGSYELKLSEGQVEVIEKGLGQAAPYSMRQVGIYLVVDTEAGLVLLWDKKTSIFLRLSPEFKGRVCGLCGNFDDNAVNDFTTRGQSVVGEALEFGNSWKFSPTCPDAPAPRDPCTANPYRKAWAQRQCSLIHSAAFRACHAHVEPARYYEACVSDACACDSGGDCECFCTAVAAYAQACQDAGVCVAWRTPDVCPLFCDYYNPEGQCEWHYQPCGAPCLRTCRNPRGQCLHDTSGLEGCYPKCPPEAPIFDEDAMRCVATCPTPPPPPPCQVQGKSYRPGAVVPSDQNCHSCICTENGVRCAYDAEACVCSYNGRRFRPGDIIYHTTDGTGGCISARCGPNGTIERTVQACSSSSPAPPTTFSFSSATPPRAVSSTGPPGPRPSPATSPAPTSTPRPRPSTASVAPGPACGEDCLWSAWLDVSRPGRGLDSGDFDTLDNLRAHGYPVCQAPRAVECRAERAPDVPFQVLGQQVDCSPTAGLTCYNRDQVSGLCDNYQIRVLCCSPRACPTSRGPVTHSTTSTSVPTAPVTTPSPAPVTTSTSPVKTTCSAPSPMPASTTASTTAPVSTPAPGPSEVPGVPTTSPPPVTTTPSTAPVTTPSPLSPISCWRESCSWTEWLDGSYPEAGINSGDFDTFQNLRSKGYAFCERPRQVECRAERFPDTPLAELGQTVVCSDSVGLLCLNKDQLPPICYNYQIRIQCCQWADVCRERTIPPGTSGAPHTGTQTQGPGTSTQHWPASSVPVLPGTTTLPSTHTVTTFEPITVPSTPSVSVTSPTETTSHVATSSTSSVPATSTSSVPATSTTSVPATSTTSAPTSSTSSVPATSTTSVPATSTTSVPATSTTSAPTSSTISAPITTTTPVPAPRTTHPTPGTTHCQPQCTWTKWFDVDFPSPGPHGGDLETYSNIVRSGERICRRPEHIAQLECRAQSHPEVSIARLGQVVQCRRDVGLVCRNRDQAGRFKMCLNYEVRVLCCEPRAGCPTFEPFTVPSTPSVSVTSPAETTSHVATSSTTSVPTTSTTSVPATSTTSVPATSTTSAPTSSTSSVPATSTTSVPTTSTTSVPATSTTSVPATSTTSVPATSTTSVPATSTSSVLATSTTSVPATSTTSAPTSSTSSVPATSTTSVPTTSTTSVPATSTTSVPATSTTSVPATSTTSVPATSTSSVPATSTTSVPATSTTSVPATSTTSVPATSTSSAPTSSTTSAPITTTTPVPAPRTTHPTPGTTHCQPQCTWTKWFDVDFPSPGPHGGDLETYSNIVRSGERICRRPEHIAQLECRAQSHPEVSIARLGQVVQCRRDVGLVCRNRDQAGRFKMCLNYEVRVLCCEPRAGCPTFEPFTVPSTPSVSVTSPAETTSHVATSSTTSVPTTSTTSVPATSTTSVPATSTTSVPATSTTSAPTSSTSSVPATSTTSVPTTSTTSVPATSTTSVPATSTTSVPATSTTSVPATSTSSVPATSTTSVPATSTTSAPTSSTSSVPATSTTSVPTTSTTSVPATSTTSVPATSTTSVPATSTSSVPATSTTSVPATSTTSVPATSTSSAPTSSTTSAPITTTTPVPAPRTTHPTPGTTHCQPQCTWTKWFDVDFPSPGPHGGDLETYSNIVRSGERICRRPEHIAQLECRAQSHPEVSIARLGQVVQCRRDVGLVCRNRDQAGRFKMCLNYEVRVLCCEPRAGCPTFEPFTVPSTPSVSVTSPAETTSHVATSSTTSVPTTSTTSVPATSTTSVPATSTTSVPATSTSSVPATSTTSVPATSTTSAPTSSTSSVPATSTTSVPTTSTTSVPATSTTSVPATSTTSAPTSSTSSVPATSTTSVPATSTTSVLATSTTSVPATSTSSAPTSSTTSAPITTTTPVPAPRTTHPTPGTTHCQPQCTWTKWFDVDFPSPGPHGGDLETYSNIVRSGERICRRPEHIAQLECRAQSHPEVSIARLGQVVQCRRDVGLVCRNRDQAGRFKMCLNYEVRVLCCEPRAGCPLTSVTPYVTPTKSLPTTPSSSVVPTATALSSAAPSLPPCYCSVAHKLYPAGSIIYQEADLAGHCYYAVCSLDCHVVRQTDHACPTSTPPSTPATLPPGSSPSAPVPVTTQGCPNAVPPRTRGETWAMPNCSQATCEGNSVITLGPRPCPQAPEPTCANGYPALKVPDEDGCCLHYQCQCVCSGWGDPHYITFDGTYYTFLDNCTYVLVQQIVPVYGHFRVLIDNYFCDSEDGLSCPQSIIVEYRQERVVLTRKPVRGVMTNEIIFNNKVVSPGFSKGGLVVSQVGIRMYVTIPEIGVQVMFTGLIFSVEVPFSKFANNTEGQCGTCTNDPKDECRLPGGAVVTSCSDMSGYWKVTNPDQPSCHGPPQTRPTVGPTTPPAPCPPSPICELILSDVFEPCHAVIPPRPYYLGCTFDHCRMTNADVVCSGLELYASLCASHGVCIDWRGRTNRTCPFTCPADKVYQPCGPSNPPYCYGGDSASLLALQDAGPVTEGCFCPEGMTLFSASKEVCVPTGCPRCMGPHGEPVEPGHTVSSDCQECTCEAGTWTMSCRSQPCALPPACPDPGLVPVPASPQAGQCCPQYTCVCNTSYCPELGACPEGTRQILTHEEGACCPSQKCSWTVCSVNGTLYQPGAIVSSSLCETCRCEVPGGPPSDTFRISCETQTCHSHCPVGFEYRPQSGQCCGACVQVACVMNTSDSSAHLFYPGETWSEPGNRCVTHECEQHQDGLVVVTTKKACPPLSCPVDQARLSEDGCCLSCPPPQPQNRSTCALQHTHQVIRLQGCSSAGPVRLAYCQGNCGDTASVYSLEAQALEHRCRCCQELRASPRNVTLRCADGSHLAFSYAQVEECGCVGQRCDTRGDLHTEGPAPLQRWDPEGGRWSRGAGSLPLAEGRLPPH